MERNTPIDLDWSIKNLDPNAQQVIINAAQSWVRNKQNAVPTDVAPADAGRVSDEQVPAPVDAIKLINTTTDERATIYDIEVSVAGTLDVLSVLLDNDGNVQVRAPEV